MKFNHSMLKSRIRVKGYTYSAFAKELGITANSLYEKLKGNQPFKVVEIYKAKELLDLPSVDDYFFVKSA